MSRSEQLKVFFSQCFTYFCMIDNMSTPRVRFSILSWHLSVSRLHCFQRFNSTSTHLFGGGTSHFLTGLSGVGRLRSPSGSRWFRFSPFSYLSSQGNGFPEAKSSIGRIMSDQHPQAFGTCNLGGKANHSISSSRIKRQDESREAMRQGERGRGVYLKWEWNVRGEGLVKAVR